MKPDKWICGAHAKLSDTYEATCRKREDHDSRWHRDGEVRWRVTERKMLAPPVEPHLHTLKLRVTGLDDTLIGGVTVPLACGAAIRPGQAFSRQYWIGGVLARISGEVT